MSVVSVFVLLAVNVVVMVAILPMAIGSIRFRKSAEVVLPVRPVIKLLVVIAPVVFLLTTFPLSLALIGLLSCFVVLFLTNDIMVNSKGIYFFGKLIGWQRIQDVSAHEMYLEIRLIDGSYKRFLKAIWDIRPNDLLRIKAVRSNNSSDKKCR